MAQILNTYGNIPWRRAWQPTPVFLTGKSHGQRSLVDYIVHEVTKESGYDSVTKQQVVTETEMEMEVACAVGMP